MKTSEQINELATALAKAQNKIKSASKDSNNPHFNRKYADLASVWNACREPLTENGLSVVQIPADQNGRVSLTTMLMHTSGQFISSELSTRPTKDDAQGLGSAITYLRRYGLAAMVGVAPDDDDDGNGACTPSEDRQQQQPGNREADRQRPPQERNQRPPQQQPSSAQQPSQPPAAANIEAPRPPTPNERLRALLRDEVGCKNAKEAEAVILISIGKRCLPADLIPEDAEAAIKIITDTVSAEYPYTRLLAEAMAQLDPEPAN